MKGLAKMIVHNEATVSASTQNKGNIDPPTLNQKSTKEQVIFSIRPTVTLVFIRIVFVFVAILVLNIIANSFVNPTGFLAGLVYAAFFLLILAAILASAYALISYYFTKYTLSTHNLVIEGGILGKSRRTIPIQRIQDISINQSWLERPLNIGDILAESAGGLGRVKLKEVAEFHKRVEQLMQLIDSQDSSDGLSKSYK